MPTETPAQRARRRKVPSELLPPAPPRGKHANGLKGLTVVIRGREFVIGPNIEGDPTVTASSDAATRIEMTVRDVRGRLQAAMGTEAEVQKGGIYLRVDGVLYALTNADFDGLSETRLTWEDEVKDRLTQFDRFVSMRRSEVRTFARFALRLADEARRPPLAHFHFFCPELRSKQEVPNPVRAGRPGRKRGTGASPKGVYRVKGEPANGRQRAVINAILLTCQTRGASTRVMTAAIMVATQESIMGMKMVSDSGQHHGPFHQDASYGTIAQRRDTEHATSGFLDRWKARNGSLKTASGDLAALAEKVQVSGLPANYRQWQKEAERTVERWQGGGDGSAPGDTVMRVEPYEFTRGERNGEAENSWDCLGRYASERNWRRWVHRNVLWLASEEELRASAPSLKVDGDEPWLLSLPSYSWAARRTITEVRMRVLAERWGVEPGAVVTMDIGDARDGNFIVHEVSGGMVSPEAEVVLRRPSDKKREPAQQVSTLSSGGFGSVDVDQGGMSEMKAAARRIGGDLPYAWGGGHGKAGTPSKSIRPGESQVGYDCSGYVCAILAAVGHGFTPGGSVIASGGFASWGQPGRGSKYTVWYSSSHVWIEFADGSRADTSPHGCGSPGPRYRTCKRSDQGSFSARHWRLF